MQEMADRLLNALMGMATNRRCLHWLVLALFLSYVVGLSEDVRAAVGPLAPLALDAALLSALAPGVIKLVLLTSATASASWVAQEASFRLFLHRPSCKKAYEFFSALHMGTSTIWYVTAQSIIIASLGSLLLFSQDEVLAAFPSPVVSIVSGACVLPVLLSSLSYCLYGAWHMKMQLIMRDLDAESPRNG